MSSSAPATEPTPFAEYANMVSGPPISVYVGANKTLFAVPKALLCYHSEYFQGALSGNFVESIENKVTLAEEDPEIFKYVVGWMHRGDLNVAQRGSATKATGSILCRVYYLADMLQVQRLMRDVLGELGALWSLCDVLPLDCELITEVWAHTPETSELRAEICHGLAVLLKRNDGYEIRDFESCFLQIPGFAVSLMEEFRRLRL